MPVIDKKTTLAKPFLKWAGGKTQLITEIENRLPIALKMGNVDTYIEPFLGGGAVFFYIAQKYDSIKNFCLFDINQDLINCYKAVKQDVNALIDELSSLQDKFLPLNNHKRKEFYLNIRRQFNTEKFSGSKVKTAAKLIFLNKTCFNGLYRVNKNDRFNVPFGDYKTPKICAAQNLKTASKVLQKAKIICADFEKSKKYITNASFVYLDPPYRPLSQTAAFTSYSKENFSEKDQIRLAQFCKWINSKGAFFLLSNSDPQNQNPVDHFFENTYNDFQIDTVTAGRAINCKASRRGRINELLITNYQYL